MSYTQDPVIHQLVYSRIDELEKFQKLQTMYETNTDSSHSIHRKRTSSLLSGKTSFNLLGLGFPRMESSEMSIPFIQKKTYNINEQDSFGNTELIRTIQDPVSLLGNIMELVQKGANVNLMNVKDESALLIAAKHERPDIFEFILGLSQIDIVNKITADKETVLIEAIKMNGLDDRCITKLLEMVTPENVN